MSLAACAGGERTWYRRCGYSMPSSGSGTSSVVPEGALMAMTVSERDEEHNTLTVRGRAWVHATAGRVALQLWQTACRASKQAAQQGAKWWGRGPDDGNLPALNDCMLRTSSCVT